MGDPEEGAGPGTPGPSTAPPRLLGFLPSPIPYYRRDAARSLLAYLIGVLVFSAIALLIELASGDPLAPVKSPLATKNYLDAIWHLGTAFLIVLPTRHRALIASAPFLALGLDVDHIFGSVLPTVVHREAHDLLFVVLIALVVGRWVGRAGALAVAGAALEHIAVDGGAFPFLAPVSTATFPLPWPANLALLTTAAFVLFFAVRAPGELRRPMATIPLLAAIAAVAALQAVIPGVGLFDPA